MKRIIWHWTAGAYGVVDMERKHYHFLIDQTGKVHEGHLPPEANLSTRDGNYVAHTRGTNTGAIGVAVDAMHGAQHTPFSWGSHPMTNVQVQAMVELTADLCETYRIPVRRSTILSHAEVEPTLGIKQRGKWDITVLPGMSKPTDPAVIGDELRRRVTEEMAKRRRSQKAPSERGSSPQAPKTPENPLMALLRAFWAAITKGK